MDTESQGVDEKTFSTALHRTFFNVSKPYAYLYIEITPCQRWDITPTCMYFSIQCLDEDYQEVALICRKVMNFRDWDEINAVIKQMDECIDILDVKYYNKPLQQPSKGVIYCINDFISYLVVTKQIRCLNLYQQKILRPKLYSNFIARKLPIQIILGDYQDKKPFYDIFLKSNYKLHKKSCPTYEQMDVYFTEFLRKQKAIRNQEEYYE
ncbi:MAG TPA: hypothetical protein VKR58_05875 [Aquella sp.]|nr:hypothetical protein [Aquella sp.]